MSKQREAEDRTGKYGGDDGALENEREETTPGEDSGLTGTPTGRPGRGGETQPERKQDEDLKTGEENPG